MEKVQNAWKNAPFKQKFLGVAVASIFAAVILSGLLLSEDAHRPAAGEAGSNTAQYSTYIYNATCFDTNGNGGRYTYFVYYDALNKELLINTGNGDLSFKVTASGRSGDDNQFRSVIALGKDGTPFGLQLRDKAYVKAGEVPEYIYQFSSDGHTIVSRNTCKSEGAK